MTQPTFLKTRMQLVVGLFVVCAIVFLVGAGVVLSLGRSVSPTIVYLVIIVFSFLASLVTFVLFPGSQAEIAGKQAGSRYRISGSLAAFVIVFVALWKCAPGPDTRTVRIVLLDSGSPVEEEFSVVVGYVGGEPVHRRSDNYQVSVELPSHITSFSTIALESSRYRLRDDPPFKISDDFLRLNVIRRAVNPDPKPGQMPGSSFFPDFPNRALVNRKPTIEPKLCDLEYRNLTGQQLRLLLMDCSRYYHLIDSQKDGTDAWLSWPFPPSESYTGYDHFDHTTGWYCFAIKDSSGAIIALKPESLRNVCQSRITRLTVKGGKKGEFVAEWQSE